MMDIVKGFGSELKINVNKFTYLKFFQNSRSSSLKRGFSVKNDFITANKMRKYLLNNYSILSLPMKKRDRFLKRAEKSVSESIKSRDVLLGGVSRLIETLDKEINNIGERLEEWYSVYFPELKAEDKEKYARMVLEIDRKNIDKKELAKIIGQKKADRIAEKAGKSLGAELPENDLGEIKVLASHQLSTVKLRKRYISYQDALADEICPNMARVCGADIAAKMIAHVGSLKKLALLPSSTIQVIGAEKALFKHLKNKKVPPPKHGIIFQHPYISSSPKRVRGKIARALSNSITTAAKADAFTKRNISEKLKNDLDKRYKKILSERSKRK